MNLNLNNALQTLPTIVYFIVWVICVLLALSWLVLPWTISAKLSAILRVQERQLQEMERINRRD